MHRYFLNILFIFTAISVNGANYRCDPAKGDIRNDGSEQRPWPALSEVLASGKVFNGGDIITLGAGNHGAVAFEGANDAGYVTIESAQGEKARLSGATFGTTTPTSRWRLKNITIYPDNDTELKSIVHIGPNASSIQIVGCDIGINYPQHEWNAERWRGIGYSAIDIYGKKVRVLFNSIRNVRFGIRNFGGGNMISYNTIDFFSAVGIENYGSATNIEYNLIKNCVNLCDYSHSGILFNETESGAVISNVTIRGNYIIGYTRWDRKFTGTMMGIASFTPRVEGCAIENNVIICDHWHGLSLFNASSTSVLNNTIVDAYLNTSYEHETRKDYLKPLGPCRLWVENKTDLPANNVIANNLVSDIRTRGDVGLVKNNPVVESSYKSMDATFIDWQHLDFRLRPGSEYVKNGVGTLCSSVDATGVARNCDAATNVGAYENTSTGAHVTDKVIVGDKSDVELRSNGVKDWNGQPVMNIGGASDKYNSNAFLVFTIPAIPAHAKIERASLSINLEMVQNSPSGSVDLFAVMPAKSSELTIKDFYQGSVDKAELVRLIEPSILSCGTATGRVELSQRGSLSLADFINTLIESGARAGDNFMLRLNHNSTNIAAYSRWRISAADSESAANRPSIALFMDRTNGEGAVKRHTPTLHIFPSPSYSGSFKIWAEGLPDDNTHSQVCVNDSDGKELLRMNLKEGNNDSPKDITLERGTYMAVFSYGTQTHTQSFFVW